MCHRKLLALLLFGLCLPCQAKPDNDNIFPPGDDAASSINFDGRGFIINGKRTFIASGSVHYARVPRENWRDVLLKLKRSGFNTVQSYVFWNYHEETEGHFDFASDSRNFGAFLDMAKDLGLYAIVRPGPYSCAEWRNGGFPDWLIFKPGIEVRKENQPYLAAVDAWWNQLLPVIASRQINKGGNVILVQLENEMPTQGWRYWGTSSDGAYMDHLRDLAHKNGITVPMFFSGLNHGHDPAPAQPIDSTKRSSPWISTELWTLWFDQYGNDGESWFANFPGNKVSVTGGERHIWRVLSQGGAGLNLYMFHGGTTFGFDNFNNESKFDDFGKREKGAACYDFGTLVGQTGNVTNFYRDIKRLGYFAESFSSVLADSVDSSAQYQDFASTNVHITARTAPAGTLVFLDNHGAKGSVTLKSGSTMKLAGQEIVGLPVNFPLVAGVTLAEADSRILNIVRQGPVTTIVCYGEAGDSGRLQFSSGNPSGGNVMKDASFKLGGDSSLSFIFPSQGVGDEELLFGSVKVRVLVMNQATADQTWFAESEAGRQIIVGAPYLGDYKCDAAGKVALSVQYPWNDPAPTELTVYGIGGASTIRLPTFQGAPAPDVLPLAGWEMCACNAPVKNIFDDRLWFTLPDGSPPEMQQDGSTAPYAWYRVRLVNTSPVTSLVFNKIAERAAFFVDGQPASVFDFSRQKGYRVPIQIPTGDHEIAVFVSYLGRRKFDGYTGSLDSWDAQRGLRGPVAINGDPSQVVTGWKMSGSLDPTAPSLSWTAPAASGGVPAYFHTHFHLTEQPESGVVYRFHSDGLSTGNVWLNGHNLGRYPDIVKNCPGLWLPSCWMKSGNNSLVVFDVQGNVPDHANVSIEANVSRHQLDLTSEAGGLGL